jgi:hypothetical protein
MFMCKEDKRNKTWLRLYEELNQFRNRDNSTVHKTLFYCVQTSKSKKFDVRASEGNTPLTHKHKNIGSLLQHTKREFDEL